MIITGGKYPILQAATILMLTATLLLQPIARASAQPQQGDYIVTEWTSNALSSVTPEGIRSQIFTFAAATSPAGIAVDSAGNYIIAEQWPSVLSMITPGGFRTAIFPFADGTLPHGVAIDSAGNYIVAEFNRDVLSKVTPAGARTVIYNFGGGSAPWGVAIVPMRPSVGGLLIRVNKLAILSPYLVLLGVNGVAVAVVTVRRRGKARTEISLLA